MIKNFNFLAVSKNSLARKSVCDISALFNKWIVLPDIEYLYRQRIFTPFYTFWLFLYQVLLPDMACSEIVRKAIADFFFKKNFIISTNTAAYCKARLKLPLAFLMKILTALINTCTKITSDAYLWHNRNVKVVDGSSVSMPDSPANQKKYPQPSGQKPGCGFPIARMLCVFSLSTGIMIECIWDNFKVAEKILFIKIWSTFKKGDVILGDRNFCTPVFVWMLNYKYGVDCVMRRRSNLNQSIKFLRKLSDGDCIYLWHKPKTKPDWIDLQTWDSMPSSFEIRQIEYDIDEPGKRTENIIVFTTLLDEKLYPKKSFVELYLKRWKAELFLHSIKITMGMEILRCKTPEMIDKEIVMHIIAYNLIRMMIYESAQRYEVPIDRISFKGTIVTIKYFYPVFENCKNDEEMKKYMDIILLLIANDKVPLRPNRKEPRAIKRRMKRFQLLTKDRHVFQESPHRGK